MENELFANLLNGIQQPLPSNQIVEFCVYCSSKTLSLDHWVATSLTLYKVNFQLAYDFLLFVEKNEINRNSYKDFLHQPAKIQIYNNLAVLTLAKALRQSSKENTEKMMEEVRRFQSSSEKVSMTTDKNIMFLRGFLFYYNGDMAKAANIFKNFYGEISQSSRNNEQQKLPVISLITLAQINFVQKNYQQALKYYKKALLTNRGLPVKARLGMAYCFYELQKYEIAEMCFRKILKLQQHCIQALIGIANIRYKDEDMDGYFTYLEKAYTINKKHPLVILHLAEHFLLIGEQEKAMNLSLQGLKQIEKMPKFIKIEANFRNDYEEFKARFHNIIAQVHHIRQQYQTAIKHYLEGQGKNLPHNEVGLAQAYISTNMLKDSLNIMENVYKNYDQKVIKQLGIVHRTMAFLLMKVPTRTNSERGPEFFFKEAIKYNKNDYEAQIDYGSYLGETQKENALKHTLNAKNILQNLGKSIKPDLLNNIAVFYMQNRKLNQAIESLLQAQNFLKNDSEAPHEELVRNQSLSLNIYFNLALAYQRNAQYTKAIGLHEKILSLNKFYVDSWVQLAYLHYQYGNKKKSYEVLEDGMANCGPYKMKPYIRIDKIITLKAHFQHLDGSNGQSKETLRQLSKMKHLYNQLYELSLNYENMIRKQVQLIIMKDFLRPNRGFCLSKCREDPFNFYSYMICIILLLTDQKISNEQGLFYFNCLKLAEIQFPIILYNFGIFRLKCEDYSGAVFAFTRYNEKSGTNKAGQLVALSHLLSEEFEDSLKTVKLNILKEPSNIKYRFQYAYVMEKKVQRLFEEEGRKNMNQLKKSSVNLNMCHNIYKSFSKLGPADYVRNAENPDMKERVRSQLMKIRMKSEDRKKFVESQLDYYQKKEKEIMEKEEKLMEEERMNLQKIKQAQMNEELLARVLSDSDDEEVKKRREKEEKKKQMLDILSERAREARDRRLQAEGQAENDPKKGKKERKRTTVTKRERVQKKAEEKKKRPIEQEDEYESEDQFIDSDKEMDNDDIESEKKERKKQKKKKKKKNRDRERRRSRSDDSGEPLDYFKDEDESEKEQMEVNEKPRKIVKKDEDDDEDFNFAKFVADQ